MVFNTIASLLMSADELPHDVIVSIQRVLEIQSTEDFDRLDSLSEKFDIIEILNDFFQDGTQYWYMVDVGYVLNIIFWTGIEASLAHLDAVSARLAETQVELQKEVDLLQAELRVSQDPERMLVIQEMISVWDFSISLQFLYLKDVRTCLVKCPS